MCKKPRQPEIGPDDDHGAAGVIPIIRRGGQRFPEEGVITGRPRPKGKWRDKLRLHIKYIFTPEYHSPKCRWARCVKWVRKPENWTLLLIVLVFVFLVGMDTYK